MKDTGETSIFSGDLWKIVTNPDHGTDIIEDDENNDFRKMFHFWKNWVLKQKERCLIGERDMRIFRKCNKVWPFWEIRKSS